MDSRRQRTIAYTIAFAAALFSAQRGIAAEEYNPFAERQWTALAPDRVIIKLRSGTPPVGGGRPMPQAGPGAEPLAEIATRMGLKMHRLREIGSGMQVIQLEGVPVGASLESTLQRLRTDPGVEFVEPDARMRAHRAPWRPRFGRSRSCRRRSRRMPAKPSPCRAVAVSVQTVGRSRVTRGRS